MIDAFQPGVDLHKLTASVITGKPIDQVSGEERRAAKAVNFGLIYTMGAKGLREYAWNTYGVSMTDAEAQYFLTRFFEAYQGMAGWHKQVRDSSANESRTILGRRRKWNGEPKITELLNSPIQGTAADITKRALSMLPDALQETGAEIIGCVHDEIILESQVDNAEESVRILNETMVKAGEDFLNQIKLEARTETVESWGENSD